MSLAQHAVRELKDAHEFFNRSTRNLTEAHSAMMPAPGMMTTAQHVAHAAQTVDWFLEGAFRPEGFDMDFAKHAQAAESCTSLASARAWLDKAFAAAQAAVAEKSDAELMTALPPGPILGGEPRMAIFAAITDHSAHHRGALTVYARLSGVVPPMPYMEM